MRVVVAGHYRLNPKTGRREWVDTYTRHVQGGGNGTIQAKSGAFRDMLDDAQAGKPGARARVEAHVAVHNPEPPTRPTTPRAAAQAADIERRRKLLPGGEAPTVETPGWQEVKERDPRRGAETRLAMTDEAWAKYAEAADDKLTEATATKTTANLYKVEPGKDDSPYTDERLAQQEKVADAIMERAKSIPKQRKAVFVGGLPGAGKSSSLAKQGITDRGYFTLDSDLVKEEMIKQGLAPEVEGLTPLETAGLIHQESSDISDTLREKLAEQGTNLVIDGTMTWQDYVERQHNSLLNNRYEQIMGLYVDTDPDEAEKRTFARYREGVERYLSTGKGLGGRLVSKVVSKNARNLNPYNTFNALRDVFHSWVVYDNSGNGGPKLVEKSHDNVEFSARFPSGSPQRNKVRDQARRFLTGDATADDVIEAVDFGAESPKSATGTKLLEQDYADYVPVALPNGLDDIRPFYAQMSTEQRAQIKAAIAKARKRV